MANFRLGEGGKLGKALPQHKLMQDLLDNIAPRPKKVTKSTQTDAPVAKWISENDCYYCSSCKNQERVKVDCNRVKKQVSKYEAIASDKKFHRNYRNLLESIRERVVMREPQECDCCSCCSDSCWSDSSGNAGDVPNIIFPRETRQAVSLQTHTPVRPPPPYQPPKHNAWPGVAERIHHQVAEKRSINSGAIVSKITAKLSKIKLNK